MYVVLGAICFAGALLPVDSGGYELTVDDCRQLIGGRFQFNVVVLNSSCGTISGCNPNNYSSSACAGRDESKCSGSEQDFDATYEKGCSAPNTHDIGKVCEETGIRINRCRTEYQCVWDIMEAKCIRGAMLSEEVGPLSCATL